MFSVLMGSYIGFYFAFPLFPTIFLNSNYHFLPEYYSPALRSILLGATYATYYIGAFIGTPIIGKLSDSFGKKEIISITFLLVGLMYLLSACAIQFSSLSLLLIVRFFTGFFDGCYSLAYTTLISMNKNSTEKLSNIEFWTSTVINTGWIIGSFIGWNLITHPSLPISYLSIPFVAAASIYLSCFAVIFFYFKGPLHKKGAKLVFDTKLFCLGLNSFKHISLRPILISTTTLYAATFTFTSYIPIFLMKQYHFEPAVIGTVESFLSFSYCFAPFTFWIYSKYCSRKEVMCISAFGTAISLILFMTITFQGSLWLFLFMVSYFGAIGYSFSAFLVTDHAPIEEHGEALGVSQSLFILIEASVSFLCGLFAAIWLYLPLIVAVACSLFSAFWIFNRLPSKPKHSFVLS
jgi:MFS family permease